MIYVLPTMPRKQNKTSGFKKKVFSKDTLLAHKASLHCLIRDTSLYEKVPNHTAAAKGGTPISLSVCLGEVLLVAFLVGRESVRYCLVVLGLLLCS